LDIHPRSKNRPAVQRTDLPFKEQTIGYPPENFFLLKETFSQNSDCKKLSIYSQPDCSFFTTKLPQPISGDQGNSLFSIIAV